MDRKDELQQNENQKGFVDRNFRTIILCLNAGLFIMIIWFGFDIREKVGEASKRKLTEIANYSVNFGMEQILRDQNISLSVNGIANQIMQRAKDVTKYKFYNSVKDVYGIQTLSTWERNSIDFKIWLSNNNITNAGAFLPLQPDNIRLAICFPIVNGIADITSLYKNRKNVLEPGAGGANTNLTVHAALDIACAINTKVRSASDGYVIKAGNFRGLGKTVWVYSTYWISGQELNFVFVYGHLNKFLVRAGEKVEMRQNMGLSGSSGFSNGPHTHFEIVQLDRSFKSDRDIARFIERYYIDGRSDLSRDPLSRQFEIIN